MAFVSYFDQPVNFRTKDTDGEMMSRLGTSFFSVAWQETHPVAHEANTPPPQKPTYNVVTGRWDTEGVRETERVYFL